MRPGFKQGGYAGGEGHASQEQTLGGKKWPSVVNPLGMFYIVLGAIKAKNEKNWLGNIAFTA